MHHPTSQDHVPESGKTLASKANRAGVAERCEAAAVHKTLEVALALLTSDDPFRTARALSLLTTAPHHAPQTLSLLQTVPGMGTMLRRVWLYAMPPIDRCARVQACASSARLVTCRTASGGNRVGTSGNTIGHAHRTWALSAAATLFWRNTPQGPQLLARVEHKPDTGKALRMLAHTLGRAVSCMLTRTVACARALVLQPSGSSAGEPGASRDAAGMRLARACATPAPAASVHATARLGRVSRRPRACLDPRSGS